VIAYKVTYYGNDSDPEMRREPLATSAFSICIGIYKQSWETPTAR
jgi:hypothetical protein